VRRMRKHPASRGLAGVLSILMLALSLLWGPSARAQRSNPGVYVLDFNNATSVGGALLGRVAAAQVSLQLSEGSQNWDVVPDSQVQRRIQELNLKAPFDRIDRAQIATGVDATAVIYGSILEAGIQDVRLGGAPAKQAVVRLQVVAEDIATGVLMNGSVAQGKSTPRMGFTGDADVLLEEALGKAAFSAREFMDRFRRPEGTVMNTTVVGDNLRTEVLLNIGARQGVRRGMEMIVTRLRETVGRVRVTSVEADVSVGYAVENFQGVRPEDRVRAIFNFRDFPTTRSVIRSATPSAAQLASAKAGPASAAKKPAENLVRITKAEPGAQFLQFRARQEVQVADAQPAAPPPVVVDEPEAVKDERGGGGGGRRILSNAALKLLVGGLLVSGIFALGGRGGRIATRPHAVEAFGFQYEVGSPGAFIKVRWERPKPIKAEQVVQYVIFRFDQLGSTPLIVGAFDGDAVHQFVDSEATRTVNAFDGVPGSDDAGARTEFANVPGIAPGQQYRYQVATVYNVGLEDRDLDMLPDTGVQFISPLSTSSPWVTAITPPLITTPVTGEQVNLNELTITWQQTPGADTYFILVSPDPNYPKGRRVSFGPFKVLPVDQGGDDTITQTISVGGRRIAGAATLNVSVGARNSSDKLKPQPNGAIFGPSVQIRPENLPPSPPNTDPGVDPGAGDPGGPPGAPALKKGRTAGDQFNRLRKNQGNGNDSPAEKSSGSPSVRDRVKFDRGSGKRK